MLSLQPSPLSSLSPWHCLLFCLRISRPYELHFLIFPLKNSSLSTPSSFLPREDAFSLLRSTTSICTLYSTHPYLLQVTATLCSTDHKLLLQIQLLLGVCMVCLPHWTVNFMKTSCLIHDASPGNSTVPGTLLVLNEYLLYGLINPFLFIIFKVLSVTGSLPQPQTHSGLLSLTKPSLDPNVPPTTILFLPCIFRNISLTNTMCLVLPHPHHLLPSQSGFFPSKLLKQCWGVTNAFCHRTPQHCPISLQMETSNCPFSSTSMNLLYPGSPPTLRDSVSSFPYFLRSEYTSHIFPYTVFSELISISLSFLSRWLKIMHLLP